MRTCRRFSAVFLLVCCFCLFLSGCSLPNSNRNVTVAVDETGKFTETIVEETNGEDFTESELEEYIDEQIQAYDPSDSGKVRADSVKVGDDSVKIVMIYESYKDYAGFNGLVCFLGTLSEAEKAGYDLSSLTFVDSDGKEADKEVLEERKKEWKVLILNTPCYVRAPDKILYTTTNVTVTGRLTANIDTVIEGDTATSSMENYTAASDENAYIIYK